MIARQLEMSVHADALARELALAVHRTPLATLPAHEQEEIRQRVEALIRSFDMAATACARYHARQTFFRAVKQHEQLRAWDLVSHGFDQALTSYFLHLSVAPMEPMPTPEQDAALAAGSAR